MDVAYAAARQEELAIVDRAMKRSRISPTPRKMVSTYWNQISDPIPVENFLRLRASSRTSGDAFVEVPEHFNPWKERLPRLSGGLLALRTPMPGDDDVCRPR